MKYKNEEKIHFFTTELFSQNGKVGARWFCAWNALKYLITLNGRIPELLDLTGVGLWGVRPTEAYNF